MRDSRRVLYLSLAASLGIHALGLYFLVSNPMLLRYSLSSLFGISIPAPSYLESEEQLNRKNREIEEVFKQILVLSPHLQEPFDLALPSSVALAPQKEEDLSLEGSASVQLPPMEEALREGSAYVGEEETIAVSSIPFHLEQPRLKIAVTAALDESGFETFEVPKEDHPYLVDRTIPKPSEAYAIQEAPGAPAQLATLLSASHAELPLLKPDKKLIELDTTLALKANDTVTLLPHETPLSLPTPSIEVTTDISDYALTASYASTTEWNEDFDLDIAFLPHPDGTGYIFSLTLNPNFDISQYSLKHDITFILDRTVRKHRFSVFTRAVAKALSCLQRGDTFNIYVVDDKLTRFNTHNVSVMPKTIHAAEEFLGKQSAHALFGRGDIYSSLEKILPEITQDDSVHTAIILSDGISQLSTRKQQRVLKNWMEKNDGKVCIYTAAVGDQNDLMMLDFLSSISGGKLLWSETHAAFPRKLAKCVLDLKDPLATELVITAHPLDSSAQIQLSQASAHAMPTLFSHQPYTILGSIDKPGPFELTIQGRHRDQWIAIKKRVCFTEGIKADSKLLTEWSAQKAQKSYAQFLAEGKPAFLKEARDILKRAHQEAIQR